MSLHQRTTTGPVLRKSVSAGVPNLFILILRVLRKHSGERDSQCVLKMDQPGTSAKNGCSVKSKGLSGVGGGCSARRRRPCSVPGCLPSATVERKNAISANCSSSG